MSSGVNIFSTESIEVQGKVFPSFKVPEDRKGMYDKLNEQSELQVNKSSPQLAQLISVKRMESVDSVAGIPLTKGSPTTMRHLHNPNAPASLFGHGQHQSLQPQAYQTQQRKSELDYNQGSQQYDSDGLVIKQMMVGDKQQKSSQRNTSQNLFGSSQNNLQFMTTMASGQAQGQGQAQQANFVQSAQSTTRREQEVGSSIQQTSSQQAYQKKTQHTIHKFSDIDGSGDLYQGEFIIITKLSGREIVKHGLGTIQYANGSVYEGMWKNGLREGYGRLIHPTGDMYLGDWKNDKANGKGKFSNLEGYSYEGDWVDDCQHGRGTEIWESNQSKYVGYFEKSKKNGEGSYTWADGSYYEGQFMDGVFEGHGVYFFADLQKTYTGDFKDANMEGYGTEVWNDGKVYQGQFRKGRKNGEGQMTYPNQKQYNGPWQRNQKHGTGIEINLKVNTQRVGEWRNGRWMRWLSSTQKIDPISGQVIPPGQQRANTFDNEFMGVGKQSANLNLDQSSSNGQVLYDYNMHDCQSRNEQQQRLHTSAGLPPYAGLAADDSSQISGFYLSKQQKQSKHAHMAGSPTSAKDNRKCPILSKEVLHEISASKSQNLGRINNKKQHSRNNDNLGHLKSQLIGKSAQHSHSHQNQYFEFGSIQPIDTHAHRPCCKGRTSYLISNHTSLNMSRRVSRRNSRNMMSTTFQKGQNTHLSLNVSDYGHGSRSQLGNNQQASHVVDGDTPDRIIGVHNEGSGVNVLSSLDNATGLGLEQDHFKGQEQGIAMLDDIIDVDQENLVGASLYMGKQPGDTM